MKLGPCGFGRFIGLQLSRVFFGDWIQPVAQNFLLLQSFVIKYTPHDHMGAVKLFSHLTYLQGQVLVPAGASGLQKFVDGEAFCPLWIWAKTLTTSTNMLNTCPVHSCAWKKCSCWTDNSSGCLRCCWPKRRSCVSDPKSHENAFLVATEMLLVRISNGDGQTVLIVRHTFFVVCNGLHQTASVATT